jgi:hypothetical protein
MSQRLSPDTEARVEALFPPESRAEVADLLIHQCGNNLPLLEKLDEFELERFQFAALKLSGGSVDKLRKAIQLAKSDWRDLLVSAGFGDVNAHKTWFPAGTITPTIE